jgi:hypothetical protein
LVRESGYSVTTWPPSGVIGIVPDARINDANAGGPGLTLDDQVEFKAPIDRADVAFVDKLENAPIDDNLVRRQLPRMALCFILVKPG